MGILPTDECLKIANEKNLDLCVVSEKTDPPVAKILDYNKLIFDQKKKEREAKKNQKKIVKKEIKIGIEISQNDFNTKVKQIKKFIEKDYLVKIIIPLRTRDANFVEAKALDLIDNCKKSINHSKPLNFKREEKQFSVLID